MHVSVNKIDIYERGTERESKIEQTGCFDNNISNSVTICDFDRGCSPIWHRIGLMILYIIVQNAVVYPPSVDGENVKAAVLLH